MLNRLRWQLTLLYLLVAAGLVVLIGGGSYALVLNYFHNSTDLALAYKMAGLFQTYNIPLPAELAQAKDNWNVNNLNLDISRFLSNSPPSVSNLPPTAAYPAPTQSQVPSTSYGENEDGEGPEIGESEGNTNASGAVATPTSSKPHESEVNHSEDPYDARLAPIFVLPLNNAGQLISNPNPAPVPVPLNQTAWEAALKNGSDWRTIRLDNGTHVRLLTYRTNSDLGTGGSAAGNQNTPAVLQIGRLLSDQDRVSSQLFSGLAILGGLSVLLLGAGSWWLSGRTMGPAQRAWDQQQQFVSNASHELRTPLTLLRATAEYGLRQSHTRSKSDVLRDVLDETDYMSKLVDDLLLLSRLDAQRLKLARDLIPLPELLGEVSRQIEKLAFDRGVEIELGNVQGAVWGDPTRLRQVLLILLDNALHHTPAGGKIRLETGLRGRLRQIVVSDSGEGIPAQHLAHIFERFYQVDPGGNENRSSGLGLSIAKGLVEAQAGIIRVESQPGKGTRFSIALPGN